MQDWIPRTELGKDVANGKVTSLEEIFRSGKKIKEPEIVDRLVPGLQSDLIFIGGSPGKGGGIRRTPTRRTARMHRSGRRYKISAVVVVGNSDGYVGIGKGEALEHRVAIWKATEAAKLNIIPVKRGCGSWECSCGGEHSIPMEIKGKAGSVTIMLKPAPKGLGLCINNEAKKVLRLAGIRDIWSKSFGESRTRANYVSALYEAFKAMNRIKGSDEPDEGTERQQIIEEANAMPAGEEAAEIMKEEPEKENV